MKAIQISGAPRAVVVSRDPEIRDGWAKALEASGVSVTRCVGPDISCVLQRGSDRCPLLEGAAFALYHEPVLKEPFVSRLRECRAGTMIIATRDRQRVAGDHEPSMSRIIGGA